MVKKILLAALSFVLVAALLCGCWGSDSSSASATPTPTKTPAASTMPGSDAIPDNNMTPDSGMVPGSGTTGDDLMPDNSTLPDNGASMNGATMKPTLNASWNLTLVNAENPLNGDFSVSVRSIENYPDRKFDERAADALEKMLADAQAAGNKLYLVSAYRSTARQAALYERKVNWYLAQNYAPELARTEAAKWVAAPGTSEHNLGLAADIVSATWYSDHDDLTEEFEDTPAFDWLAAHCADYGFVLRYPKGKEYLTGIAYEPWHYRYVGEQAAAYLTAHNLCMEELS